MILTTTSITFSDKQTAREFATQWTRYTKTGHTIGSDNKVSIWGVTDETQKWIDSYLCSITDSANNSLTDEELLNELFA